MNIVFENRVSLINYLKQVVDAYYAQKINDAKFISIVGDVYKENRNLIYNKDNEYYFKYRQELGKKRLKLLDYALIKVNQVS